MNITRMALPFAMIGMLSACGYNTKAVSDFNDGATGLTKSYTELMEKNVKWCYESMLASQLGDKFYSTNENMKSTIDTTCKEYAKNVKTAEASAEVVNTYAAALSALVGVSPQFLEDDAKNLKDAALTIKNAEGEQKLTKEESDAFESLANTLSEMITTAAIKKKATDLMRDHSAAVNRQVDFMVDVSKKTNKWVAGTTNNALILNLEKVGKLTEPEKEEPRQQVKKRESSESKIPFTNEQAIPYRYLAYVLSQQHPDQGNVDAAIASFEVAAKSFKDANNDLENKFSTLSKKEQLDSIVNLKDKVDLLRNSMQTIRK